MRAQLKLSVMIILWIWLAQVNIGTGEISSDLADANLMFEFLLGGISIDRYNNILLHDEELASMRKGQAFLSQMNDEIPKSLDSMKLTILSKLKDHKQVKLNPGQFGNHVLSMAYCAHKAYSQDSEEERQAWGETLLQLANITVHQLRGSYLFNYS